MSWVALAMAAIELATELANRALKSGELTDEEDTALRAKAYEMFKAFSAPPPPPPPPEP